MDPVPVTSGASHTPTAECALCDAHEKVSTARRAPMRRRSDNLLPWLLAIGVSGPFALLVDGAERWVAFGLLIGLASGAFLVWRSRLASERHATGLLAANVNELNASTDERVSMVIRQFEWAVNDVANLRDALKRAQDARAQAEGAAQRSRRYAHRLERQLYEARLRIGEYSRALGSAEEDGEEKSEPSGEELVVPLVWRVFEENELQWVRFESAGIVPSQLRVLNAARSVVAISARSLDATGGEQVTIVVPAPEDVRVALERDADDVRRFRFEALVDETWCPVELRDARASGQVHTKDKRGRVWRPGDQNRSLIV